MNRLATVPRIFLFGLLLSSCATVAPRSTRTNDLERYDFYFAPTFFRPDHYTVERRGNSIVLRKHSYRGMGGYSPKKLPWSRTTELSEEEWEAITEIIEEGDFWEPAVTDVNEIGYLDAIEIRFTGMRDGREKTISQYGEYDFFLFELEEHLRTL